MTSSSTPAPPATTIVAAIDFSELSDRAVHDALLMCHGQPQTQVHILAVGSEEDDAIRLPGKDAQTMPHAEANEYAREHVARLVQEYVAQHGDPGPEKIAVYVASGHPAERIVALAVFVDADTIVMGTHGRTGLKRIMLGSVAEEVVRRAPCTVVVLRPKDFLKGEKVPDIHPPLKPGEHALRPFEHRPTYHYVSRNYTSRTMPAI